MCQNFNVRGKICYLLHSKPHASWKEFPFVLGESRSLLWSGFGKVIHYLSCAVCLGSILWKHGSEPTWETSQTCQATKRVTDERWNKSQSNTIRCRRETALKESGVCVQGCFVIWGLLCQGSNRLVRKEHRCVIYIWGKVHYKSVHHRVQAAIIQHHSRTLYVVNVVERFSCFGESVIHNLLTTSPWHPLYKASKSPGKGQLPSFWKKKNKLKNQLVITSFTDGSFCSCPELS